MLRLDVRLDGFADPVGTLTRGDTGAIAFAYRPDYLALTPALPLSLSLPLDDRPYADPASRAFFGNLLQERDGPLLHLMARHGLARDDIVGLLHLMGGDCPGAISVLPEGAPPAKVPGDLKLDYVALEDARVESIVRSLHERQRLPEETADPSPLAGVQSKLAVTLLPDGRLALPRAGSGAPTTHILKVPDRTHPADSRHEYTAMQLATAVGFDVAATRLCTVAGIETLLVSRFDRDIDGNGRITRLHQEDFAQALGLPRELKYQRNGLSGRRFDAAAIRTVLDQTESPAQARATFIRATLFDLLIGNTDGHAKNHALLYSSGRQPRLAPRYDLLPVAMDPDVTELLAYDIGEAQSLGAISRPDIEAFLTSMGLATAAAHRRWIAGEGASLIATLAATLPVVGQTRKRFADLIAGNIRTLAPRLGIPVPGEAESRDLFHPAAGGW